MSDFLHLWGIYLGTLIGLLPIINPLSSAPTFLAITEGDSQERRREQALKGSLYMVAILVCFLVGGTFIMRFFGISIPGLRITAGSSGSCMNEWTIGSGRYLGSNSPFSSRKGIRHFS